MLRFLLKNRVKAFYLDNLIVKMRTGGISSRSLKLRLIANREDKKAWQVNGIKPHFFTLILKQLTKIEQFIFKWQK
jgi:glycosyltransferase